MISKTQDEFKRLCYSEPSQDEMEACHIYAWNPSKFCRYCKRYIHPDDFDSTRTYWLIGGIPGWFPCHKECKTDGYKLEAYQCQCVDADCNDCLHFRREGSMCVLDGSKRIPNPNFCSGMKCFVHRKDDGQR